jgi:MarR family transcriptional regulator for hemolysin
VLGQPRRGVVELTTAGDQLFRRLREAAMSFDRRLRAGLTDDDTTQLEQLLHRLRTNVTRPATSS